MKESRFARLTQAGSAGRLRLHGLAIISLPTMDPPEDLVRLQHVEGDRFRTIRSDEQPGHEVIFTRDESGRGSHLSYHGNHQPIP